MAKPNNLVLDGSEVKFRLEADRQATKSVVHIDWVRFTCLRRNVLPRFQSVADIFPKFRGYVCPEFGPAPHSTFDDMPAVIQVEQIQKMIKAFELEHRDPKFQSAMHEALELAITVRDALGPDFLVSPAIKSGRDFYKHMWSITRNEAEVGWVGFLASGSSKSKQAQDNTIHVNLYGAACTFAAVGWQERIADLVDQFDAKITRVDLALDFFDGLPNGRTMETVRAEYVAGAMNVNGKRPSYNMLGGWASDHELGGSRSFYIGSKANGKETNIYEKGDQLFGREANNPWVRVELRYGNKLRVLESDILRRPADFFGGASEWHQLQLLQADAQFTAQKVPVKKHLAVESVKAEVTRSLRWALSTAAPTLAALAKFATESALFEVCLNKKLPGRLQKFNEAELQRAFHSVFDSGAMKKPFFMLKDHGTESTHSIFSVGGASPSAC